MQRFEIANRSGAAAHLIRNQQDGESGIGLMTVPEAATELRLTRKAVYALIWDGALAYVRIGRRIRIPRDQLVGFVQERMVPVSCARDESGQPQRSRRGRGI